MLTAVAAEIRPLSARTPGDTDREEGCERLRANSPQPITNRSDLTASRVGQVRRAWLQAQE